MTDRLNDFLNKPPALLDVDGVVSLLNGPKRTATYEALRRGEIPGLVRLGRKLFVRGPVLAEWLRGAQAQPIERETRGS